LRDDGHPTDHSRRSSVRANHAAAIMHPAHLRSFIYGITDNYFIINFPESPTSFLSSTFMVLQRK
jgi:hypothetical protein